MTVAEARQRVAQYVAICGVASVGSLRESLVFKGGNALDFVWHPNRSTLDLDFSLDMPGARFDPTVATIRELLRREVQVASARFGVVFSINSVRQQPPGENKTFITYKVRVGYGLPDEGQLLLRMANNQTSPHMLPIEISINEPIVDSTTFVIDNRFQPLRVGTIEDIVGENREHCCGSPCGNGTNDRMFWISRSSSRLIPIWIGIGSRTTCASRPRERRTGLKSRIS